jgi:hypothetical protein
MIDAAVREFTSSGEGAVLAFADYARAVLCNGLGRYQDALTAATAPRTATNPSATNESISARLSTPPGLHAAKRGATE